MKDSVRRLQEDWQYRSSRRGRSADEFSRRRLDSYVTAHRGPRCDYGRLHGHGGPRLGGAFRCLLALALLVVGLLAGAQSELRPFVTPWIIGTQSVTVVMLVLVLVDLVVA